MPTGTSKRLSRIWGTSRNDVWAIGAAGTILHWDGKHFSSTPSGTTDGLEWIWGTGSTSVWTVTWGPNGGHTLHWNGAKWSQVDSWSTVDRIVRGSAVGPQATSGSGTVLEEEPTIRRIWGSGPRDIWIAGKKPVFHWNGSTWSRLKYPCDSDEPPVWTSGPADWWFIRKQTRFIHWDGRSCTVHASGTRGWIYDITGSGPSDLWSIAHGGVLHWEGMKWALVRVPLNIAGIWASAPHDVWATSPDSGVLLHWDGAAWSLVPSGVKERIQSLWGSAADDVWAITSKNEVLHYGPDVDPGTPEQNRKR